MMELLTLRTEDLTEEEYAAAFADMSPARQEKCRAYRREADRKCCIAADCAVRRALSSRYGVNPADIEILLTDAGKPYAPAFPTRFSYAHSGEWIALALSDRGEVGVDVELIRPVMPRITRYFCCEDDLRYVFGEPAAPDVELLTEPDVLSRLFEIWTFKEALGKAWGTGLTRETKYAEFRAYEKHLERLGDYMLCAYEEGGTL